MTEKKKTGDIIEGLRGNIEALKNTAKSCNLTSQNRKQLNQQINGLLSELEKLLKDIDPIRQPSAIFDPANPDLIGRFIALALVAQTRHPLRELDSFYGSGVYAIYYKGKFKPYLPISSKEVPIYVGKAEPEMANAKTPSEQGPKLSTRLNEHRKNIEKATDSLQIVDFECRYLVVQSGWESAAEKFLIEFFQPAWNNETNICYGIGKHGDSSKTRANKRSPWDTLHPGRSWADDKILSDAFVRDVILKRLADHFHEMEKKNKIYPDVNAVLDAFLKCLRYQ